MSKAAIGVGGPCRLKFRSEPTITSNGIFAALRASINAAAAGSGLFRSGERTEIPFGDLMLGFSIIGVFMIHCALEKISENSSAY
jgi:hypothetical protein